MCKDPYIWILSLVNRFTKSSHVLTVLVLFPGFLKLYALASLNLNKNRSNSLRLEMGVKEILRHWMKIIHLLLEEYQYMLNKRSNFLSSCSCCRLSIHQRKLIHQPNTKRIRCPKLHRRWAGAYIKQVLPLFHQFKRSCWNNSAQNHFEAIIFFMGAK